MLNCEIIGETTQTFFRSVDKNFANLSFETKCQGTHEEFFLLDSTDERKRLEHRRARFEHETFFILSAFYTWHRLFVTRQTLTRLNWWKRAGFICTAINFGNTCNDNAENANIYEERKNTQRERERRVRFYVWFKHWKWNDFIRLILITFVYFGYMWICVRDLL